MDDVSGMFDKWLDQVEKSTKLSVEDKAKITGAGAQAFADVLSKNTPRSDITYTKGRSAGHANAKHRNSHRKTKHLADSITHRDGYTADKLHTGDTDVGYEDHYYDFLARIINDGKHNMSPKQVSEMHFVDKSQAEAKDDVTKAMGNAARNVLGGDKQ